MEIGKEREVKVKSLQKALDILNCFNKKTLGVSQSLANTWN